MRILAAVDGSSFSNSALRFIGSRTTLMGKAPDVSLLNVQLPIPSFAARVAGKAMVRAYHQAEASDVLEPALAMLKKTGLPARARYVVGSPGPTIAKVATAEGADLIVMGSHGHTAFKGLLFGSVTSGVLASCSTPLLIVRGSAAPAKDSLTVGIAIDGSKYGLAAVRYLLRHRDLFGAAPVLTLIHVVPDLSAFVVPGFGDAPVPAYEPDQVVKMQKQAFVSALAAARKLIESARLETAVACLVGNNHGDEIAAYARKERLDLLLMGSHGYGALNAVVLGSVATRVAAKCTTPLLLIRAK